MLATIVFSSKLKKVVLLFTAFVQEKTRIEEKDSNMLDIHPNYIEKNGRTEFVILTIEEFNSLQSQLEDMEDLLDLRRAKEKEENAPTITLDQLKSRI